MEKVDKKYCNICKKVTVNKHIITTQSGILRNYNGCAICNGPKEKMNVRDRVRKSY